MDIRDNRYQWKDKVTLNTEYVFDHHVLHQSDQVQSIVII